MIPRPGRLRSVVGSPRLPEIHIETGGEIPRDPSGLPLGSIDEMWRESNTFPMMRLDVRQLREPVTAIEYAVMPPYPDGLAQGENLRIMVSAYVSRFDRHFAVNGKPMKYALLIVGLDSDVNSHFISRDPQDGYVWPQDGTQSSQAILVRTFGPSRTVEFFGNVGGQSGAFDRMRVALDTAGLPRPVMLLGNVESRGDVGGTGPYGLTGTLNPYFPAPGEGFIEKADPLAMLTRAKSVEKWFVTRNKDQNSQAFDPFAPLVTNQVTSGSPNDPINGEALMLANSAVTASFADGLAWALFEPFRTAFGSSLLCGEWDVHS